MTWWIAIIAIILVASGLLSIHIAAYAQQRGRTYLNYTIMALGLLASVYTIGYALELTSTTLEQMLFFNFIQYLAIPFLPAIWVFIAYTITQQKPFSKKIRTLYLLVASIIFLARASNVWFELYYLDIYLINVGGVDLLALAKGPMYYFYVAYVIVSIVLSTYLYYRFANRYGGEMGKVARRMLWVALIPFTGLVLNVSPLGNYGIDMAALLYPIAALLLVYVINREHFVELKPFVRNKLFDESPNALLLFNEENRLVEFNKQADKLFPNLNDHKHKSIVALGKIYPFITTSLSALEKMHTKFSYKGSYYRMNYFYVKNSIEQNVGMFLEIADTTEEVQAIKSLEKQKQHIEFLSYHDALTQTKNRYYLDWFLKKNTESNHPLGIIYVDLNDLKKINDTYGHQEGDALLKKTASILLKASENQGFVVRLGGDEFLIVLLKCSKKALQDTSQNVLDIAKTESGVSLALGTALKVYNESFEDKYKEAEDNMYETKQGR